MQLSSHFEHASSQHFSFGQGGGGGGGIGFPQFGSPRLQATVEASLSSESRFSAVLQPGSPRLHGALHFPYPAIQPAPQCSKAFPLCRNGSALYATGKLR